MRDELWYRLLRSYYRYAWMLHVIQLPVISVICGIDPVTFGGGPSYGRQIGVESELYKNNIFYKTSVCKTQRQAIRALPLQSKKSNQYPYW
jgi:hypothetical protein